MSNFVSVLKYTQDMIDKRFVARLQAESLSLMSHLKLALCYSDTYIFEKLKCKAVSKKVVWNHNHAVSWVVVILEKPSASWQSVVLQLPFRPDSSTRPMALLSLLIFFSAPCLKSLPFYSLPLPLVSPTLISGFSVPAFTKCCNFSLFLI